MNDIERAVDALEACEKNLRVIHEAAGPEPFDESAPPSFEAWRLVEDALARLRRYEVVELPAIKKGMPGNLLVEVPCGADCVLLVQRAPETEETGT